MISKKCLVIFGENTKLIRTKILDMSVDGFCNISGVTKSTFIALEKGYRSVDVVNYLKVVSSLNKAIITLYKRDVGLGLDIMFKEPLQYKDLLWMIDGDKILTAGKYLEG